MRSGYTQHLNHADSHVSLADEIAPPDYTYGSLSSEEFREILSERGSIMLRNAVDVRTLNKINDSLTRLFEDYANIPADEFERHLKSSDPVERDLWEQIKLSHIYDRTFKPLCGNSYYELIRSNTLWDFAACAWPECLITESAVCNSRRMYSAPKSGHLWDTPIDFHVDAQFFYDEKLSINFWTPLVHCGVTAPGLKVVLLGINDTKEYLEYNPEGHQPEPGDIARMHKFRCKKMNSLALKENGLLPYVWAPQFNAGDILVFSNFTLYASHVTQQMTESRTSVEVRINLDPK